MNHYVTVFNLKLDNFATKPRDARRNNMVDSRMKTQHKSHPDSQRMFTIKDIVTLSFSPFLLPV
jgi:hypothetical protein